MELKIIPVEQNTYPLCGILLRGNSVSEWIRTMQKANINLSDVHVYPLPDNQANSVWGCFVLFKKQLPAIEPGRHEFVQQVSKSLFIAERSKIYPHLSDQELEKIPNGNKHIFHPYFGLVELDAEVDFKDLVKLADGRPVSVEKPQPSIHIPARIRSFQVQPIAREEVLQNLEGKVFPKREERKDKPISILEKIKFLFYKTLFRKERTSDSDATVPTGWGSFLRGLINMESSWDKMEKDFDDLEKRNRRELDKLVDLLKKNPSEALKYAIPLDDTNTGRGGVETGGTFTLSIRWFDFSLFSNSGSGNTGGSIDLGNDYHVLRQQYASTALELINQKEYDKAAFIYMKLLKEYRRAADTLAMGGRYQEAATIHLKHTGDKLEAAVCFEKGCMWREAINIYQLMNNHEKVGDLYMVLDDKPAAMESYQRVVDQFKTNHQYLKASMTYRDKMADPTSSQRILHEGWTNNVDAVNCLCLYFSNIGDPEKHRDAVSDFYQKEVNASNTEAFLQVIRKEYQRTEGIREMLREMAFEIVASKISSNSLIVNELKHFNPDNQELSKDTLRFRLKNK